VDLKKHVDAVFEINHAESVVDEAKIDTAIEHHGVFVFGEKS